MRKSLLCLLSSLFFFLPQACLGQVVLNSGSLSYKAGCLSVHYAFQVAFPEDLNNLIRLGVAVHLGSEFRLEKKRRFWFDEQIVDESREWKISYHAITGKYYLIQKGNYLFFDSLGELLTHLSRVDTWKVSCALHLADDTRYQGMMRVFIVTDKLPPVFQIGSGGYIRWQSDSGWLRWNLMLSDNELRVDAL